MNRYTSLARSVTSTGNVPERSRRCPSGRQIKYPADHDVGRRGERTSIGAQENYINGFSGTHLLAGDLGPRKTQYSQESKRPLPPSWCLLIHVAPSSK